MGLILKRVAAIVGVASVMTLTTGCTGSDINQVYFDPNTFTDQQVVITQKDKDGNPIDVKHRADVTYGEVLIDRGGGVPTPIKYEFECNENPIYTNKGMVMGKNIPEEFYDEECPQCFPDEHAEIS